MASRRPKYWCYLSSYCFYGVLLFLVGGLTTSKGFTGQYNDNLTGLDDYGSRYYDPTAGVFLSADSIAGDLAGANPYEYVNANPETNTDPSGAMVTCGAGCGGGSPVPPPPPVQPPSAPYLLGGTGGEVSNGNSSPCGDPTNSSVSCAQVQLLAKTDWQMTVQVPTHIDLSSGRMLCHSTGGGLAVGPGFGGFATLTATSPGNSCSSSGNDEATGTTTVTVHGSSVAPLSVCFSVFVNCSDEGAKNASGSGEGRESGNWLAADTGEEGNVGGDAGDGPLYRNLRPGEDPSQGLYPKDPNATKDVASHVAAGSRSGYASQFISTTKDLNVALKWNQGGPIAVIDPSKVIGEMIDISTREGLAQQGITWPSRAYSYAISSQEVLVKGVIPPEAIIQLIMP